MPAGGTAPRGPRGQGPRRTAPGDQAARRACAACRAWPGQVACRADPTRAAWTSSGSSSPASPPARRSSPARPPAAVAALRPARRVRRMWAVSRSCYSDPIAADVKRVVNGYVPGWTALTPVLFQEVESCSFAQAPQASRVPIRFQAAARGPSRWYRLRRASRIRSARSAHGRGLALPVALMTWT